MKKRGQVEARIIIYVLAVFIAGVILIYGYTVIKGLAETQENILLLSFKEDVKAEVEEKSYEFRSSEKLTFIVPKRFTEVCYGDSSRLGRNRDLIKRTIPTGYTLIRKSMTDDVRNNFFMMERGVMRDAFYAGDLFLGNVFECTDVTDGQLNLKFTALGRQGVEIMGWN